MNVTLSFSASTSSQSQSQANGTSTADKINFNTSAAIKDLKDLTEKEYQRAGLSIGEEHLIRTIERAVKSLQGPQTVLDISIHERTHDIMVKVLNKDTGEVIREVPPERTLDLVANMMEIAGILFDEKV